MRTCLATMILTLASLAMAGTPDRIPAGYDTWITVGGGATFMSFGEEPIPADFFCAGSDVFTGRIHFEGVPLASDPPGSMGASDTLIERIDDALFEGGEAFSRIRVKAIHLESRETFANDCGVWSVRVGLTEEQPTTTIEYTQMDAFSGTFNAELVLNIHMTFTNVDNPEDVRVLNRTVHFTEFIDAPYMLKPVADREDDMPVRVTGKSGPRGQRGIKVDTDADGIPDSVLGLTTTTSTGTLDKIDYSASNWHYYNGWVCPIGVYPPDRRCVLWGTIHEVPTHAHVTLPGAPPNPCDDDVIGIGDTSGLVAQEATEIEYQEYPCPTYIDATNISTLFGQLEEMERQGRLIVSADQVLDEIIRKVEK